MSFRRIPLAVAVLLAVGGCGSSVDASCDAEGISTVIGNIVGEVGLAPGSLDSLQCEGDWAVATVTMAASTGEHDGDHAHGSVPPSPAGEGSVETFLVQRVDGQWIWKAPESVCGDGGVPESLAAIAC